MDELECQLDKKIPFCFVSGHESPKVFGILDVISVQKMSETVALPDEVQFQRHQMKTNWVSFLGYAATDRMPIMSFMLDDCVPFSVVKIFRNPNHSAKSPT